MNINELKQQPDNTVVEFYAIVKTAELRPAKNGKNFIDVTLADSEGTIDGKIWNANEQKLQDLKVEKGIYFVKAKVGSYNGNKQIVVDSFAVDFDMGGLQYGDFVQSAPEPESELKNEYSQFLDQIKDPMIHHVADSIFEKYYTDFVTYPAAVKHHHAFYNGLLFHTVSMLRIAEHIGMQYERNELDMDVIYGAIALHDVCKVMEYSDALQPEMTEIGKKIGHIPLIAMEIWRVADQFEGNKDKLIDLVHCVLSHHGRRDWGAAVEPQTKEAHVVHQIDNIDAKINSAFL